MLVAEGAVDIATEPELKLHDMAALAVIVEEAGGTFTGLDGRPGPHSGSAAGNQRPAARPGAGLRRGQGLRSGRRAGRQRARPQRAPPAGQSRGPPIRTEPRAARRRSHRAISAGCDQQRGQVEPAVPAGCTRRRIADRHDPGRIVRLPGPGAEVGADDLEVGDHDGRADVQTLRRAEQQEPGQAHEPERAEEVLAVGDQHAVRRVGADAERAQRSCTSADAPARTPSGRSPAPPGRRARGRAGRTSARCRSDRCRPRAAARRCTRPGSRTPPRRRSAPGPAASRGPSRPIRTSQVVDAEASLQPAASVGVEQQDDGDPAEDGRDDHQRRPRRAGAVARSTAPRSRSRGHSLAGQRLGCAPRDLPLTVGYDYRRISASVRIRGLGGSHAHQ